jgi:hypothetical protein
MVPEPAARPVALGPKDFASILVDAVTDMIAPLRAPPRARGAPRPDRRRIAELESQLAIDSRSTSFDADVVDSR